MANTTSSQLPLTACHNYYYYYLYVLLVIHEIGRVAHSKYHPVKGMYIIVYSPLMDDSDYGLNLYTPVGSLVKGGAIA